MLSSACAETLTDPGSCTSASASSKQLWANSTPNNLRTRIPSWPTRIPSFRARPSMLPVQVAAAVLVPPPTTGTHAVSARTATRRSSSRHSELSQSAWRASRALSGLSQEASIFVKRTCRLLTITACRRRLGRLPVGPNIPRMASSITAAIGICRAVHWALRRQRRASLAGSPSDRALVQH